MEISGIKFGSFAAQEKMEIALTSSYQENQCPVYTFTSNDFLPDLEFTITPIDFLSRSNSRVAIRLSSLFHARQQPRMHKIKW